MDSIRFAVTSDTHGPPHGLPRVLLTEHPTQFAAALATTLRAAGMEVEIAASQAEAVRLLDRFQPAIVLLHAEGPPATWLDRIPTLSHGGDCGVIVILAEDSPMARIDGLNRGADDVISRDVPPGELAARVRAVLRRVQRSSALLGYEPPSQVVLDPAHRCLIGSQGERTLLSEAEFVALETLLDADGAPVSREWLGRVALKRPLHSEDRSVDQLVLKLRRKLAASGASERTILSARRQGYVIPDPSRFRSIAPLPQSADNRQPLVGAGN
jgi:DNA-binding response OmpR family regulator